MDRERKIELAKLVLGIVATAGVLSVALIAPNAFGAYIKLAKQIKQIKQGKRDKFNYRIKRAVNQMEKKGLIRVQNGKASLTPSGEEELRLYETKQKVIERPKKWDKKWRLVIFDVWERRRQTRDAIRRYLRQLGFVCLQQSVWVYPFECREIIEVIRTHYKLRPAVLYILAESIENDKKLRQKFDLK